MANTKSEKNKTGLSDYAEGTELENIYNSAINELDKNYKADIENLNQNQFADRREAYFNNEKLMKYLPNTLKVQGLQNNIGSLSQAYIDANNNYQNNLNTINRDYNSQKINLAKDYGSQKTSLTKDYNLQKYEDNTKLSANTLDTILANLPGYASQFETYKDKYTTDDFNKIKEYANSLSENLTESDKELLNSHLASYLTMSKDEELKHNQIVNANKAKETAVSDYGISEDAKFVDASTADVYSFGKFSGTGEDGKQDKYIKEILDLKDIPNGTVVDFNYGDGKDNYMFIDGYWVKTDRNAKYDEDTIRELRPNPLKIFADVLNK